MSHEYVRRNIISLLEEYGSVNKVALRYGVPRTTVQNYRKASLASLSNDTELEFPKLSNRDVPIEELISRRVSDFAREKQAKDDRRLVNVKVKVNGPIGIGIVGDPHTDDDGTDLKLLFQHAELIRDTPGLFAMNTGDNQNLWPGRLARLYAHQRTRDDEGWRLTEHFLRTVGSKWLALMKGNHDHFQNGGDPLDWILNDMGSFYENYDIRLCLQFPNRREYRIWLRHDFAGHSMWNNIHGLIRAVKMGANFHLLAAGHRHSSAHHSEFNAETGILWNAIRSAGYKRIDSYAEALQFQDSNVFQCPVVIVNPEATNPAAFSQVIYDTELAADILTHMRKRVK